MTSAMEIDRTQSLLVVVRFQRGLTDEELQRMKSPGP
jgi:hypothetical protein